MSLPAYLIVASKIRDPEAFKAYMAAAPAAIAAAGGEYLVRGGAIDVLEGDWRPARLTVIRFPSMVEARAWYEGPGYQTARALRQGATEYFDMTLVEGYLPA
ncbi:MAG: DUF1330 domain-containing protein [Inhella sp.]